MIGYTTAWLCAWALCSPVAETCTGVGKRGVGGRPIYGVPVCSAPSEAACVGVSRVYYDSQACSPVDFVADVAQRLVDVVLHDRLWTRTRDTQ